MYLKERPSLNLARSHAQTPKNSICGAAISEFSWNMEPIWSGSGSERGSQPTHVAITGCANAFGDPYPNFVALIRLEDLDGEGPPYREVQKNAKHEWYTLLRPAGVVVNRLDFADHNGDGFNEVHIWTTSGRGGFVDFSGNLTPFEQRKASELEFEFVK